MEVSSKTTRFVKPAKGTLAMALSLGLMISGSISAQELLYSITQPSPTAREFQPDPTVTFQSTDSTALELGKTLQIALPDGSISSGTVTLSHDHKPLNQATMIETSSTKVISIDNGKTLDIHVAGEEIVGLTLSDYENQKFYRTVLNDNGSGVLSEEDNAEYVCAFFPEHSDGDAHVAEIDLAQVPSLATVQNLQSRPGAAKVLYIDYWGGSYSNSAWNRNNVTIQYDAYSLDSNSTFSNTELYYMYQAWAEAAEDYAPFDVNVTTKSSIFAAASNVDKSRIIATTFATRNTYGICTGCGGIAYVGIYGRSDDFYQTGWTFNSSLSAMGMTHSHEAGHQMGLNHDGTSSIGYYRGHGDWGPIMGAPFGKRYVQWSKGEYPNADRTEDDFAIIGNKLGTLSDDVGGTLATAHTLGNSTDLIRKIKPEGAVGSPNNDLDYFKFTITGGGSSVNLEIAPTLGLDTIQSPQGEDRSANLAIDAKLWKAGSSSDIASMTSADNTPLRPNTNKLSYTGNLTAGDYYISVEPNSPDTNWSTGFGEWGNGGSYRIKLSYTNTNQYCNGKIVTVDLGAGQQPTSGNDIILGTSGNDVINAGAGYDTICGLGGNDTITGGSGSDWIDGGEGNDTITGNRGNDKIFGGRGIDTIKGGSGNDRLYGQSGNDTMFGDSGNDKLYGGQGSDKLYGGDGVDRIWGETGNDLILGGDGDDSWLDGGEHNDRVSGQQGNDIVRGGNGADEVYGGPGNDDVRAQGGNDRITDGGSGTDSCQVAPGIDTAPVNCE